jgi:hypothetical protein
MAMPRYFVPRAGAEPEDRAPDQVAVLLDVFAIQGADATLEEWVVGLDDRGLLAAQRMEPEDQLLPAVRADLAVHEVGRGRARVLAVESLHLFEVFGIDQTPDVPGLDDPVCLYGALLGPLVSGPEIQHYQRLEGQLTVSRGDVLHGLIAGAGDAFVHFDQVTDRSARTMHMLLPGARLEELKQGRGTVLAYPVLGADVTVMGPGNESLVDEILHDLVTAVWREMDHDRAVARRGRRLFSFLGGGQRALPPEVTTDDLLRLAAKALEDFPGWPVQRTEALSERVRRTASSRPHRPPLPGAPPPAASLPLTALTAPTAPIPPVTRNTDWIETFIDRYDESDDRPSSLQRLVQDANESQPVRGRAQIGYPFAQVTMVGPIVRATLNEAFSRRAVDVSVYIDGSTAMVAAYRMARRFLESNPHKTAVSNEIETTVRMLVQSLVGRARGGQMRTAYWSCGFDGREVELVGDLDGENLDRHRFRGPRISGACSRLAPPLYDYVAYLRAQPIPAERGCVFFLTEGVLDDADEAARLSAELARAIALGQSPRLTFILVSMSETSAHPVARIVAQLNQAAGQPLWRCRTSEELSLVPALATGAVDRAAAVSGGAILDEDGNLLRAYDEPLPAVLEFQLPAGARAFVLVADGKRYLQPTR